MKLLRLIFFLLVALGIVQSILDYPQLPDKVAIQFSPSGHPTSWVSKAAFLSINIIEILVLVTIFIIMPRFISKIPTKYWNFPNRDYWLSESKRNQTFQIITKHLLVFIIGMLLFFEIINYYLIKMNLTPSYAVSMHTVSFFIIGFVLFVILWGMLLVLRFARTGASENS